MSREANIAAFHEVLAAVNAGDGGRARPHLDPDVAYRAPYYSLEVGGADDLVRMFGALGERFDEVSYTVTDVHPALDPDLLFVEARGDHAVRGTDRRYRNTYLLVVRFRDGRIVEWVEHSDPAVFQAAVLGA